MAHRWPPSDHRPWLLAKAVVVHIHEGKYLRVTLAKNVFIPRDRYINTCGIMMVLNQMYTRLPQLETHEYLKLEAHMGDCGNESRLLLPYITVRKKDRHKQDGERIKPIKPTKKDSKS